MAQGSGLTRYEHLKALFARRPSQDTVLKDDSNSETTLVPSQTQTAKHQKKREVPRNYNPADMCFGSCCRN
ncbi:hypothetical protein N7475_003795 [Penicillium sp. IBT 31633x]|nr:hypothetical protein N7475_003795 [Penicillium sp. IBT 31633x]